MFLHINHVQLSLHKPPDPLHHHFDYCVIRGTEGVLEETSDPFLRLLLILQYAIKNFIITQYIVLRTYLNA